LAKEVAHLGVRTTLIEPGPVRTDFADHAKTTAPQADDYLASVGQALDSFQQLAGNQPNDPARVAEAIIEVVEAVEPPRRVALGVEALEAVREKLQRQLRELELWDSLGRSTRISA
jgi:NAD(P)-dependent dehydrogenase (short-subunit alcohol dehydrogenase family)